MLQTISSATLRTNLLSGVVVKFRIQRSCAISIRRTCCLVSLFHQIRLLS
ncbi:MAG: hypothetical protein HOB20_00965 [Planctomycetaceae bacterium]|nr:hypothetical protein [Planctomycetaceae bacterium]